MMSTRNQRRWLRGFAAAAAQFPFKTRSSTMHIRHIRHATAAIALLTSPLALSSALATPPSSPPPAVMPVVNGNFGTLSINTAGDKTDKWGMHLKTLDDTDIGVDRLTFPPQGFSGWHTHPSPVFVTVTQGSIVWTNGSDPLCTSHTYSAGQSFIEDAYVVHHVRNASNSASAEFVAVVIKPAGFIGPAFRLDRAQPNNCSF